MDGSFPWNSSVALKDSSGNAQQADDAYDGAKINRLIGKSQSITAQRVDDATEHGGEQWRDDVPGSKVFHGLVGAPRYQQDAADYEQRPDGDRCGHFFAQ